MKIAIVVILLVGEALFKQPDPLIHRKRAVLNQLISHGTVYDFRKYPYLVRLSISSVFRTFSCTGSLITPLFVLTAAHCTDGSREFNIKVIRGSKSEKMNDYRNVRRIYQHKSFNRTNLSADISLIRIQKSFNEVTRFVVLSGHPSEFANNTALNCFVIGFGINELENLGTKGYITNATVRFGPNACKPYLWLYHDIVREAWNLFLCSEPDISMICKGDSGGPMICHGKQYGIASNYYNYVNNQYYYEEQNDCGNTYVQTRHLFIYPYRDWISETIKNGTTPNRKLITNLLMLTILFILFCFRIHTSE